MNPRIKWTPFLFKLFISLFALSFSLPQAWAGFIFEFDPLLTSEEKYDDNIFLSSSNKRSDWITTISPGFTTSILHPRLNLTLEYQPNLVYFLHNPQYDYTGHNVDFNATFELSPRLTFTLDETYIRSNDPELEELLETDYEREYRRDSRETFDRNIISPQLEYRFGRENLIRLYYRNMSYKSDDPTEGDQTENYFESELEYWFNVKNGINLQCNLLKGNFEFETDLLNSIDINARYRHRFTPHFELYSEYGAGVTDFEDSRFYRSLDNRREVQIGSEDVEDYDLRKFNFGFEWFLPRNLRIEGSVGYFWRDGVGNRDDQGITSQFEIEKTIRDLTLNLRWRSGYSASYFAIRDSGFSEFWRISTNLTYNYRDRLEFFIRGSYGYREYTEDREDTGFEFDDREDYRYTVNTAITYHILRNYHFLSDLSFEIGFNHIELDSNFDRDRYINNQFIGRLTVTF